MTHATFTIRSIQQETSDTKSFEIVPDFKMTYRPGQFITVVREHGTHEFRRQYSLCSHPEIDAYPRFAVKRIPNGEVSRWLFDEVKVGDVVKTIGPSGFFTLPTDSSTFDKIVMLAAGSGITPIISLVKEVLHFHTHLSVVLIYSNHSEESTIFLKELQVLQTQFSSRFSIEFLFSNAQNLRRARLGKYILEELFQQHIKQPARALAFICGPLDYRQMANITLLNEGMAAANIRKEIFHTPLLASRPEPPDTAQHSVYISYEGQSYQLQVQYPQTILQTAKDKGVPLPYSCEAGRCGTCAATCVEGKVWMSRNEVLLDKEIENGRVLTCTGYPVGGDVRLTIK